MLLNNVKINSTDTSGQRRKLMHYYLVGLLLNQTVARATSLHLAVRVDSERFPQYESHLLTPGKNQQGVAAALPICQTKPLHW
jgi:hypothetical protein